MGVGHMNEEHGDRGDSDVMPSERGLKHQSRKKEKCHDFLAIPRRN